MEGRAAVVRGAAAGVLGDGRERERRLGRFAAQAVGLAVVEGIPGSAAPRSVARQSSAPSVISVSGRHRVSSLPCRHAWRGTGIWSCQDNRRGQKC